MTERHVVQMILPSLKTNRSNRNEGWIALYVKTMYTCSEIISEGIWIKMNEEKHYWCEYSISYHLPKQRGNVDDNLQKQSVDLLRKHEIIRKEDFKSLNICWKTNSTKHGPSKKFLIYLAENFVLQGTKA